jgi:hypothetical protein
MSKLNFQHKPDPDFQDIDDLSAELRLPSRPFLSAATCRTPETLRQAGGDGH